MEQVAIRDAVADDAGRIVELLMLGALVGGREDPGDLTTYRAVIAEQAGGPGAVLVAEVDGAVVGVCQLIVFRHLQQRGGWCAEVESVHVHPEVRGRGVGGTLLEAAVARAAEAGCYRVQLTSNVQRPDAHRFYERHGFQATHRGFKRLLGPG